jgi:hypothetical protein
MNKYIDICGSIAQWQSMGLQILRSRVRLPLLPYFRGQCTCTDTWRSRTTCMIESMNGRVAQLVERQSNKLPVEGSSPFVTSFFTSFGVRLF